MSTNDKIKLMDRFRSVLAAEQEKRDTYSGLEWIEAERRAMWRITDEECRMRSVDGVGVPMSAIERVENFASGHVDYTAKFALGCAEIVVGERDRDGGLVPLERAR